MDRLKLYLVTDSEILKDRDFYEAIEEALKGGVKTIQLREKNALGKEFLEKAIKLRSLTRRYNALFIVNDRIDIAMLSEADGIHVGQADVDLKSVRKLIGEEKIIGVSTGTLAEAKEAKRDGANYIGVGAVFNTSTKKDARDVGLETLKEIKENVDIKIVGIGGIALSNIHKIKPLDIDGYAIISDILKEKDIQNKCVKILNEIEV